MKRITFTLLFFFSIIQLSYSQCSINITAEVVDCNDVLNTFYASITVTGTGVGSTFVLGGDGATFGSFSYGSSPIVIGPFMNDGSIHNFAAVDNTTVTCFGETQILPYTSCPIACDFDIVDVEFLVCDGLNRFANIYIDHNSNVSQDFTLIVNQVSQGTFSYGQEFYTIGPLSGNCMEGIGINAYDNFHTGCSDFYWQPGPWCCPDECSISDIIVNTYCENDEIAGIIVDFNYNGASNEQFEILLDSLPVDTSWVYEFPDTIFYNFVGAVPDNILQGFGVNHVAKPNCGFYGEYNLSCVTTPPCSFSNIVVSPITCDGENTYSLGIDFQVESATSIFFDVYSGTTYLGAYQYADLPIVVDNFPEREVEYDIITICDNGNNSCCETLEFIGLDCDLSCQFSNYFIEASECDEEGLFEILLQFDHENGSDEGFIVRGNGIIYDTFQYNADGSYTIGPLLGDCETLYEFIAIDLADPSCSIDGGFDQAICCEVEIDCVLSNLSVDDLECDGNELGLFYSFSYEGTTNDFYDLFSNGEFIGFYEFTTQAQYITLPSSESEIYNLMICENDNPDCCISIEFEGPACVEECGISDFFIEAHECSEDGFFDVDLEFNVVNPDSSGFTVFGDGNNYGSFEYGESFYTIGPFEGDCSTVFEFVVVDNDNSDCTSNFLFLGPICCEIEECEIDDLIVEAIECIDNDLYSVSIDFNYSGATNDFFDVIVDNEVIGFFSLTDLPIVVNYPASGNTNDVLSVCINDNPDCCAVAEFAALECQINVGDCVIEEVFAEAYECDDEGNFLVDIELSYQDVSTDGFEIRGNGVSYGEFEYGENFYTIGPLDGDCVTVYEFIIIDLADPTCIGEFVFEEPICCETEECNITNLEAEIISCDTSEQIFFVSISFDVENNFTQFFTVTGNGEDYGAFGYGQESYTLGPLAADGTTLYEFIITDTGNEACTAFIDFGSVECMTTAIDNIQVQNEIIAYHQQGLLFIENSNTLNISDLQIYNLDGKYVYGKNNIGTQENIELSPNIRQNGIYILVLKIDGHYYSIKLAVLE